MGTGPQPAYHDPRSRGFRDRWPVADVLAAIDRRVGALGVEPIPLVEATGRVLAEAAVAAVSVPAFARAAMDGYALRGEETFGSDPYSPSPFRVVGESRSGRPFAGVVGPGEAVRIATGAPLPTGADAVVKVESTREDGPTVLVFESSPPARHVGQVGEDIAAGATVLHAGRVLRPQDLGVLSALGRPVVPVVRRPRVAVLVTGEELLPAGSEAHGCHIPDMNSVMVAALVRRDGGLPRIAGPLADDRATLRAALEEAIAGSDAVLVSGGSSTGPEDHAPSLVAELGELTAHGVALRPASPAGIGFVGPVPVVLLPGNPVSCLCAYDFFGGRIVRRLGGRPPEWPYRPVERQLAAKLVSALGRTDYARARVVDGRVEPLAISGAAILSGTTRADSFVIVPPDREGYPAGATVTVWLYD